MNEKAQKIVEARLAKERLQTALRMLADGLALDKIARYSGLALDEVRALAARTQQVASPSGQPA